MFDQQQDEIEKFLKSDSQFRVLYRHHQELDSKVRDAEIGALPMDGAALANMKREKLRAKEQLTRMWETRRQAAQ